MLIVGLKNCNIYFLFLEFKISFFKYYLISKMCIDVPSYIEFKTKPLNQMLDRWRQQKIIFFFSVVREEFSRILILYNFFNSVGEV